MLLLLASITDMLDGFIARRWHLRTELGSYLDPAADKLLFLSTFIIFTIKDEIPVWFTTIIVARDLIIVSGSIYFRLNDAEFKIQPTKAGKWNVFSQICVLGCVLIKKLFHETVNTINSIFNPLMYVTLFLSLFSGFQYVKRGVRMLKNNRGLHI